MNAGDEAIRRLSIKRGRQLGSLSNEAFAELELAVRNDPARFVDDDQERSFMLLAQALARNEEASRDEDLLDDEQYQEARGKRFVALGTACDRAIAMDEHNVDAALIKLLVADKPADDLVGDLLDLRRELDRELGPITPPATGDAWADVFVRPRLRVIEVLSRMCLDSSRYAMARDACLELLSLAPLDALGARLTCALAMARLEDEEGFNWLDAREGRHGNAWFHLSRAMLMYKSGRMPAARRALRGYDQLCPGGAYVLLQPIFVDTYLPDRPAYESGTFQEAMLAVHEADPIVCDIPDFASWACGQPGFLESARAYCDRNGLDWRDWRE